MATPGNLIVAALLQEAAMAELLPTTAIPTKTQSSFSPTARSASKFFLSGPRGNVVGQIEFPIDQTWVTLTAFTSLAPSTSDVSTLLRRRMRLLELLVRVSMTRQCDWQTTFAPSDLLDTATDNFHWCDVLRGLMGHAAWATPRTPRALATLRWHHPRFLLQWPLESLVDTLPEWLEIFLLGTSSTESGHDDTWIKSDALRALLQDADETDERRCPRVVELGVEICSGLVTSSMLLRLVNVLERVGEIQTQRRRTQDKAQIEFRVTTLMFSCFCALSSSALEQLAQLVREAAHIYVADIQLTVPDRADDVSVQRCLASLIAPRVSPLAAPTPPPTPPPSPTPTPTPTPPRMAVVQRLWLETESKPFAPVGSAVRHDTTTHIQELSALYAPAEMDELAAWLAFGLFHGDSQSTVTALKLTMPRNVGWHAQSPPSFAVVSPHWIEVFTRVLSQVASAQDLAPLDPPAKPKKKTAAAVATSAMEELLLPTDTREFVRVKRNTRARRQLRASSELVATLAAPAAHDEDGQPLVGYQVVRKLRGWLAVVVPGAGAGWIPRAAVVDESTRASRVPLQHQYQSTTTTRRYRHRLKSFTWTFDTAPPTSAVAAQHADALMDLLALTGEPLEVLQLPNMGLENRHVARILEHCPNLKELNLCGNSITDVAPLVRAYESGICKISSLNIAQNSTRVSQVIAQCNTILTLCNQRHGDREDATRATFQRPTIQKLVLRVSSIVSEAAFTALFHTVQRDTTLEYVRVSCSPSRAETLLAAAHAMSKATDHAIVLRSRVLPLANKLAMLSVVRHASTQLSALSSVDARVLALIFRLARTSHPFLVEIRADEDA